MKALSNKSLAAALLLLATVQHPASDAASSERKWWSSRESLSDYQTVRSHSAYSEVDCMAAAIYDSTVQLVAFNASSGLCTEFRCHQGLSHCRKCRSVSQGAQRVWTTSTDCWTTVQHRVSGSVDFYRNWSQYQSGFGEGPEENYWIGLDSLHSLSSIKPKKLKIVMKPWNGTESWAEYSSFSVGPAADNYRLSVSGFSASAGVGDSLIYSSESQFTTKDADHDGHNENCAVKYLGAWWFHKCFGTRMDSTRNSQLPSMHSMDGG